jgi:predicted dehydrogenase
MLDFLNLKITHHFKDPSGEIKREEIKPTYREPLREELKAFVDCLQMRKTPKVTAQDGREALKVALEISKKIKENL